MKYCVWKHYNQNASTHSDVLINDNCNSFDEAVESAFDYLVANDNDANDFGDEKVREEFRDNKAFSATDYDVIILSAEEAGRQPGVDAGGTFELFMPDANDVSQRRVDFSVEF